MLEAIKQMRHWMESNNFTSTQFKVTVAGPQMKTFLQAFEEELPIMVGGMRSPPFKCRIYGIEFEFVDAQR